jgi:hypothetical protein
MHSTSKKTERLLPKHPRMRCQKQKTTTKAAYPKVVDHQPPDRRAPRTPTVKLTTNVAATAALELKSHRSVKTFQKRPVAQSWLRKLSMDSVCWLRL